MHYLTDGKSTLDLTQGELVQATTDELHEYLFGASAEIADLQAKLAQSDEQLSKTVAFAAELEGRVDLLKLQLNGEQAITRNLEKKVLEARSIDSSERPARRTFDFDTRGVRCEERELQDHDGRVGYGPCRGTVNGAGLCSNFQNHRQS